MKNPEPNKDVGSRKMGSSSNLGCVLSAACIQTKRESTEILLCRMRKKELLHQTYSPILKLLRWAQIDLLVSKATRYRHCCIEVKSCR